MSGGVPSSHPGMILTTACPDTTGVVAAVAGFLASHNCLITEAQHYDDSVSVTSFMRTVFHDNGHGAPSMQQLHQAFAGSVAQRFGMNWSFHGAAQVSGRVGGVQARPLPQQHVASLEHQHAAN